MDNKEEVYDSEISPRLLEIAKICKEHKMSCFFVVAYAEKDHGITSYIGEVAPSLTITLQNVYRRIYPGTDEVTYEEG